MDFFIADTHFGDDNIIKYYHRPFKDSEEMDDVISNNIIEKLCMYPSSLSNCHNLFMLGDIGNTNIVYDILNNCKCGNVGKPMADDNSYYVNVIIIKGNHDNYCDFYDLIKDYGATFVEYPIMYKGLWLSHEPITYMPQECPYLNIHGHTHNLRYGNGGSWEDGNRYYNVRVERTKYSPISLSRIKKELFIDE